MSFPNSLFLIFTLLNKHIFHVNGYQKICFPSNFLFGTATAAYQVEGGWNATGREPSIWDTYCRKKKHLQCADVADDMIHRYESDFQMMADMGLKSYRFSVSWSRVMKWNSKKKKMIRNEQGILFYHRVIDRIIALNIIPILTMYHWDLPDTLHSNFSPPGWLHPEISAHFYDYAFLLYKEYGRKISLWATFNEPLTFVLQGYDAGNNAPGLKHSNTNAYNAAHNVLLSHGKAVALFRQLKILGEIRNDARIGIVLNGDRGFPFDSKSIEDLEAVERRIQFTVGWWSSPIVYGKYPKIMREIVGNRLPEFTPAEEEMMKGSYDLFMLNHYTTNVVTTCDSPNSKNHCSKAKMGWSKDIGVDAGHFPKGSRLSSTTNGRHNCNWFAGVPNGDGYLEIIEWIHQHDRKADILLTENGWCGNATIENMDQLWYFKNYIKQVLKAVNKGIPVIGYTAWSFMDNYEWGSYVPRFGLFYVEYPQHTDSKGSFIVKSTDLTRIPRPAALWFSKLSQTGCLEEDDDLSQVVEDLRPSIAYCIAITMGCFIAVIVSKFAKSRYKFDLPEKTRKDSCETTPLIY